MYKRQTKDILECQLLSDLREIKAGISILQKGFVSFMNSYLTISANVSDAVLYIISQMYMRSNAIVNQSFYGDLISCSRAQGLINEVKNIYSSFDDMFNTVRQSPPYIAYTTRISSQTVDTLSTHDKYNLSSRDISTTIKRLWLDMDNLRWRDLVAVNREKTG